MADVTAKDLATEPATISSPLDTTIYDALWSIMTIEQRVNYLYQEIQNIGTESEIEELKEDLNKLSNKVNNIASSLALLNNSVQTNTNDITNITEDLDDVNTALLNLENKISTKQNKLIAGANITITHTDEGDVIASTGGSGSTVSVEVGTTTTGEAGTDASVKNSGTDENVVLEFTIPRGNVGETGPQGPEGPAGSDANADPLYALCNMFGSYLDCGTATYAKSGVTVTTDNSAGNNHIKFTGTSSGTTPPSSAYMSAVTYPSVYAGKKLDVIVSGTLTHPFILSSDSYYLHFESVTISEPGRYTITIEAGTASGFYNFILGLGDFTEGVEYNDDFYMAIVEHGWDVDDASLIYVSSLYFTKYFATKLSRFALSTSFNDTSSALTAKSVANFSYNTNPTGNTQHKMSSFGKLQTALNIRNTSGNYPSSTYAGYDNLGTSQLRYGDDNSVIGGDGFTATKDETYSLTITNTTKGSYSNRPHIFEHFIIYGKNSGSDVVHGYGKLEVVNYSISQVQYNLTFLSLTTPEVGENVYCTIF